MAEQLGKMEKPEAESFQQGRKLYLVPLIYSSDSAPDEYKEKCSHYWQQVTEQLSSLESKIGRVNHVYHESIFQSNQDGIKAIEQLNPSSYEITKSKCDNDASFEAIEEEELLKETMDWERCFMIGFISKKVADMISGFYSEVTKKRTESIADKINQTLKENESGLLFIREGHMVQFPGDIEVFSIFPPALDEIHRWLRDRVKSDVEETSKNTKEETRE